MIHKKQLLVTVLSAILLSACNDSNDSSSNTNVEQPKRFEQWSSFALTSVFFPVEDEAGGLNIYTEKTTLTIDNNEIYKKVEGAASSPKQSVIYQNYITQNGVFGSEVKHQYGYKLGDVAVTDQSKWVVSLPLVSGTGSLSETTQFKVLNISGQKLFYTMDPYTALQFNGVPYFDDIYAHGGNVWELYSKLSTAVFPEGSTCIQIQDISQDQETFNLFNYELPVESPNDSATLKTEWDRIKLNGGSPLVLKDVEYFLQSNNNGIAKYHDAYYRVIGMNKGITYSLNDQVTKQKAALQSLTAALGPSDIDYPKLFEEMAKQSCYYFNPTATQAIDAAVKANS